ncbi:MAG: DUF5691 domain-containing protein [Pseudomonadota bacterium]
MSSEPVDDIDVFEKALLLGLSKGGHNIASNNNDLSDSERRQITLNTIGLTASRVNLANTNVKTDLDTVPLSFPVDHRQIMAEPLRLLFVRFGSDKGRQGAAWEVFCEDVKQQLFKSNIRPHPFDLDRVNDYLTCAGTDKGTYEHWHAQVLSPESDSQQENLSWDDWELATQNEQIAFLASERKKDATLARDKLRQDFARAPAARRVKYIETFAIGLTIEDQDFLKLCLKDRSGKVADAAKNLLAKFPGAESAKEDLQSLLDKIEKGKLNRKYAIKKIRKEKASTTRLAVISLAERVHLKDIADGLSVPVEDLPKTIDSSLARPFARCAAFSDQYDLFLKFLTREKESELASNIIELGALAAEANESQKQSLAEMLTNAITKEERIEAYHLQTLYELIQGPLKSRNAKKLLKSKPVKKVVKHISSLQKGENSVGAA